MDLTRRPGHIIVQYIVGERSLFLPWKSANLKIIPGTDSSYGQSSAIRLQWPVIQSNPRKIIMSKISYPEFPPGLFDFTLFSYLALMLGPKKSLIVSFLHINWWAFVVWRPNYDLWSTTPYYFLHRWRLSSHDLTTVNGAALRSKCDSSVLPPKPDACSWLAPFEFGMEVWGATTAPYPNWFSIVEDFWTHGAWKLCLFLYCLSQPSAMVESHIIIHKRL